MPIPIIIGAAALAAVAYGGKKGYDGYQKHSEANDIVDAIKKKYEEEKSIFDKQEESTTRSLSSLGELELEVGKNLNEFKTIADELLKQLNSSGSKQLDINIPKHELDKIESYSYTAVGVLGTIAGAGATGAAAGFAVYGGVMALGAASTGTAISALSGVAATNATLAAIGGGSLATGGLGMAGGTAILGAAVAAPILAIAGWAYDKHGSEAINNARKAENEANLAIEKLRKGVVQLKETAKYASKIDRNLLKIYFIFEDYFSKLKEIDKYISDLKEMNINVDSEMEKLSIDAVRVIENGYALAAIMVNLIMTPIFKLKKKSGSVVLDNGVPVMEKDSDGSMILNIDELDKAMEVADASSRGIAA